MKSSTPVESKEPKAAYTTPALVIHGKVEDLTQQRAQDGSAPIMNA